MEKLLRKGAIKDVEPCKNQFLSNIFTISKNGGERRPVVDMRDLNSFILLVHFKMGDLSHLPSVLWRGIYMQDRSTRCISNHSDCEKIKDLSKVFLERKTVPVHMSTFWPQILSKNFHKPLLVYLRALGVRLLMYLDDILIMAATQELCLEHT